MLGGVLVEYNIDETRQSLGENVSMLESTLKALDEEMAKRQKDVLELELKYGLNPSKKDETKVWFSWLTFINASYKNSLKSRFFIPHRRKTPNLCSSSVYRNRFPSVAWTLGYTMQFWLSVWVFTFHPYTHSRFCSTSTLSSSGEGIKSNNFTQMSSTSHECWQLWAAWGNSLSYMPSISCSIISDE